MNKIKVLHIVTDFPDNTGANNTKAVKNLLDESNSIEHHIIAVRRLKKFTLNYKRYEEFDLFKILALPFGIFNCTFSFFYSIYLFLKLKKNKTEFDIIHGHKLTIDGVIAYFLSKIAGKPFMISVRADTDIKFIKNKPLSRLLFSTILNKASHVFWVSAWSKSYINAALGNNNNRSSLLPNIVGAVPDTHSDIEISNRFLFVGRLESAGKKGLLDLFNVIKLNESIELDVIGKSSETTKRSLDEKCIELGISHRVHFKGIVPKEKLQLLYSSYCALLMPSLNETFGMVYVEALMSKLPILCCSKSGIDGYLTNKEYIQLVSFGDVNDINQKVTLLYDQQAEIKSCLENDMKCGVLDIFKSNNITSNYQEAVNDAIKNS